MFPFYSFLQTVMQVLRGLVMPVVKVTKQMYRSTTVITAGCTVVAVVVFTASGFGAGGKSALTAFAEGRFEESEEALEEPEAEGLDLITEAKIQAELTSLRQESRLVGERLAENTVRQQKASEEAKAELKAKKQKIQEEKEALKVLEEIAKVRGCLKRGEELDYEKAAGLIFDDFRSGKTGRITLEWAPEEQKA